MIYLAKNFAKKKISPLKEIAKKENIPFDFLEKILAKLEKEKLLKSKKGVGGGYCLAKRPSQIKVGEILKVFEESFAPVLCVAKEKEKRIFCPQKRKCKTFSIWKKIQDILEKTLNSLTLAEVIKKT